MASKTGLLASFCILLIAVSECGAKMSYVNIGHGCPTGLRCRLDCIKDGWFFGTCHMVFCLCWPKLWTPETRKEYSKEFDEKIGFPNMNKNHGPKKTPKPPAVTSKP